MCQVRNSSLRQEISSEVSKNTRSKELQVKLKTLESFYYFRRLRAYSTNENQLGGIMLARHAYNNNIAAPATAATPATFLAPALAKVETGARVVLLRVLVMVD